ncbi:alpha/beta fold hydrolase [Paracoccus sp. S-4012]|uniref:alpha/beta fold hydrolase n=1 Tax=Paracoccus sp. S-4012 TaxID=2665648 RepID=UPI0012B091B4|nr:alpha/beta hydrolase [Paracoccus sp. S-4012]MRX50260.1 alpha/beta fold hydrolase [Paracoccus sp. S-4012]
MRPAPFRQLPGAAQPPAEAFLTEAADGVALRLALWRGDDARGTVLLFPGRTEYCEKYAPVAARLTAAGHAVLAIDWRGQGASERLIDDPRPGHVEDFAEYQRDVAALAAAARDLNLPRPWRLLAHSMGGTIGLRALTEGLEVTASAFSAPMWGIRLGSFLPEPVGARVAEGITLAIGRSGRGARPIPGASSVLDVPFNGNRLTSNIDEYTRFMREAANWPELALGPASYDWVHAAIEECRALAAIPADRLPSLPVLIAVAGEDHIVSPAAIHHRAEGWREARLLDLPDSRHEAMFEAPPIRERFLAAILEHFA